MSSDKKSEIMAMVRVALQETPDVSNEELQERAAEIDPDVGELSPRSFNARYPLQVKRKIAQEEEEGDKDTSDAEEPSSETAFDREAVREALLAFARDVAGAEDRGKVIEVLENVDNYVDRALNAH